MRNRTVFLLAVIAAMPLLGESRKEPWNLTLEERIALRTSPDLARERVRGARQARSAAATSANPAARPWVDTFDGKSHPELFLPVEVFDQLIELAFVSSPRTGEVVRNGFTPEVRRHGLPADFWPRLRSVSALYIADWWAVRDSLSTVSPQSGSPDRRTNDVQARKYADACRSRAEAFAAARNEFGRERFDRFLYEVVVVGMFTAADRLPEPQILRQAEEGCR